MKLYLVQCSYATGSHAEPPGYVFVVALLFFAALLSGYLWGVYRQERSAKPWSLWRVISFLSGTALLTVAFSPAMVHFAHHDFRGHMWQHLLIGMLAPIGLVLGAPLTLAYKSLSPERSRKITAVLGSPLLHILSHPVTALLLNVGGMFVLYLTPLYHFIVASPSLHFFLHLHFLLAGYLFTWSIIGPDPAPGRPGLRIRGTVLFLGIAGHAYLSKLMYAYVYPRYTMHAADEIRSAAKVMYYGGDFSELLLLLAFFALWYRKRGGAPALKKAVTALHTKGTAF